MKTENLPKILEIEFYEIYVKTIKVYIYWFKDSSVIAKVFIYSSVKN